MSARRQRALQRARVGKVSVYPHHGAWWVYYREGGRPVRKKVADDRDQAVQVAAQVNAHLANGSPSLLAFEPLNVAELRERFLDYHESVLRSSLATVARYRAATAHLERFAGLQPRSLRAHDVRPDQFAAYLRVVEVAPNGHPNTARRRLRDKGVRFVLETCRAMYAFAGRRRHLPPYAGNPFSVLPLDRLKAIDPKPIFVFDKVTELAFLKACDPWAFPVHFTLAKTGVRVGELTHLLVEDLDLAGGWLFVRNKPDLGWRVKTGAERAVPLLPEVVTTLKRVIGGRPAGPVFLRPKFATAPPPLLADGRALAALLAGRLAAAGSASSRAAAARLAATVWRDAGAVKTDAVRTSLIRVASLAGLVGATCPKSWRHTFATLMQDANVDPLVRQRVLGHRPTLGAGLGMTAAYTHTRPETQRQQVEAALRLWPTSLALAEGGAA
jgi:integrase